MRRIRILGITTGRLIVAAVVFSGCFPAFLLEARQLPDPLPALNCKPTISHGNFNFLKTREATALRRLWSNPFTRPGAKCSSSGPPALLASSSGPSLPLLEKKIRDSKFSIAGLPHSGMLALSSQNKPPPKKRGAQSPSATSGSPGHIFWVVPAFKVDYSGHFQPLTPREKFDEWARATYDPYGLGVGAFEATTLEYSSSDGFCGYGMGLANYGKCFGSLELDAIDSSFIGDFVLPVLWHQDPRYFRLGKGSFGRRTWYAITRVFVTRNDAGHSVFYSSALTGTVVAAAISNLYYPQQDVGFGHTMSRIGIDLGNTALYNFSAEFWPDFKHDLHHIF